MVSNSEYKPCNDQGPLNGYWSRSLTQFVKNTKSLRLLWAYLLIVSSITELLKCFDTNRTFDPSSDDAQPTPERKRKRPLPIRRGYPFPL